MSGNTYSFYVKPKHRHQCKDLHKTTPQVMVIVLVLYTTVGLKYRRNSMSCQCSWMLTLVGKEFYQNKASSGSRASTGTCGLQNLTDEWLMNCRAMVNRKQDTTSSVCGEPNPGVCRTSYSFRSTWHDAGFSSWEDSSEMSDTSALTCSAPVEGGLYFNLSFLATSLGQKAYRDRTSCFSFYITFIL